MFDGNAGNDTLNGGGGSDLFRWNRSSGNDTIDGGPELVTWTFGAQVTERTATNFPAVGTNFTGYVTFNVDATGTLSAGDTHGVWNAITSIRFNGPETWNNPSFPWTNPNGSMTIDNNAGLDAISFYAQQGEFEMFIDLQQHHGAVPGVLSSANVPREAPALSSFDVARFSLVDHDLNGGPPGPGGRVSGVLTSLTGPSSVPQKNVLDAIGNELAQAYTVTPNGLGFLLNVTDTLGPNTATVSQFVQQLDIHGRVGNDSLTIAGSTGTHLTQITYWGDEGADTVSASGASINIDAFGGDDNDTLVTGSGKDGLYGGEGNDFMNGNGGVDVVNYASFGRDLTVNLGITVAQDTRGAGVDTILNIENAIGGSGGMLLSETP